MGSTFKYLEYLEIDVIRMANPNAKIDLFMGIDNMNRSDKLNCLQSVLDLAIASKDKKSEDYWKQKMIEIIKKEPIIISDEEWQKKTPQEQMRYYYIKIREAKLMGDVLAVKKYLEEYEKIQESLKETKKNNY